MSNLNAVTKLVLDSELEQDQYFYEVNVTLPGTFSADILTDVKILSLENEPYPVEIELKDSSSRISEDGTTNLEKLVPLGQLPWGDSEPNFISIDVSLKSEIFDGINGGGVIHQSQAEGASKPIDFQ